MAIFTSSWFDIFVIPFKDKHYFYIYEQYLSPSFSMKTIQLFVNLNKADIKVNTI